MRAGFRSSAPCDRTLEFPSLRIAVASRGPIGPHSRSDELRGSKRRVVIEPPVIVPDLAEAHHLRGLDPAEERCVLRPRIAIRSDDTAQHAFDRSAATK